MLWFSLIAKIIYCLAGHEAVLFYVRVMVIIEHESVSYRTDRKSDANNKQLNWRNERQNNFT